MRKLETYKEQQEKQLEELIEKYNFKSLTTIHEKMKRLEIELEYLKENKIINNLKSSCNSKNELKKSIKKSPKKNKDTRHSHKF